MIPHEEGASGAGRFTGKPQPVTILYTNWRGETAVRRIIVPEVIGRPGFCMALRFKSNEWHPEPQWLLAAYDVEKEAGRDFALSGIKAWGQAAVDAALSASAPASGAERMTAGEVGIAQAIVLAWDALPDGRHTMDTVRHWLAEHVQPVVFRARSMVEATPAPATPPGVPDSVRALSEAASALLSACMADMGPLDESDRDDEPVGMNGYGIDTAVTFGHLRRLEHALATHPAGQSAGSGAETARIARIISPDAFDWPLGDAKARDHAYAKAEEIVAVLSAPDSTRTGDEGTEWVLVPTRMDVGMIAAFWRWKNTGSDTPGEFGDDRSDAAAYRAMIAARPTAPEAEGAERVRHVKSGGVYEVLGEAEAQIATRSTCPDGPGNGVMLNSSILREGDKLTVYRGSNGKLWCRFTDEFRDGRFTPTNPPLSSNAEPAPPSSSGQGGR